MRKRGVSLIEVLIAFSLLVLAMGMLVRLVAPAMRISRQATERMHRQQFGRLALDRLVRDLVSTSLEGLSVHESPDASMLATVHPILSVGTDGHRVWQTTVVLWEWTAEGALLTRSVSPGPAPVDLSSHPFQPTLAEATALKTQEKEKRVLLRDVVRATIVDADPTNAVWDLPLSVTLEQKWTDERGVGSLSLNRQVFLQNI